MLRKNPYSKSEKSNPLEKSKREKKKNEKKSLSNDKVKERIKKPSTNTQEGANKKWILLALLLFLLGFSYLLYTQLITNTKQNWYADADNDGYGNASDSQFTYEAPSGYINDSTDPDDTNSCLPDNSKCEKSINNVTESSVRPDGITSGKEKKREQIEAKEKPEKKEPEKKPEVKQTDGDLDGIPSDKDCDDSKANIGKVGDPCNANNGVLNSNCECIGIEKAPPKVRWYNDLDGDGKGDPNSEVSTDGPAPQGGSWVDNAFDMCPTRKGVKEVDGCPKFRINSIQGEILIDQEIEISANSSGLMNTDNIFWTGGESVEFMSNNTRSVIMKCRVVGKHKIKYTIQNTAFPTGTYAEQSIEVKISPDQIRDIIQPIVVQGFNKGKGSFEQQSKAAMEILFSHTLNKRIIVYDEDGIDRGPLDTFLTSDVKLGLPMNKSDLKVIDISYDKVSGKISELYIQFI
ncbi:hypothetical protein N9P97_02050 [Saprospiraceae bacterium]|nr:hypothetical protein [Saprospiraceae bacterium]